MILTEDISVSLGDKDVKLKIVKNSEEILTESIYNEETPVWVELWPSSLALSRWIWDGPSLSGKNVMELGAGFGLPGITAGMKGARVLLTDYVKDAVDIALESAHLNGVSNVAAAVADWRSFDIDEDFDLIIGSDILYHPDLNPYLKKIFDSNLSPSGKVIMADAGRKDSLQFIKELSNEGWSVKEEHMNIVQGRFELKIHIFQIEKK